MRNWLFLLLCLTPCCNLQAQVSDNDPISLVESKTQTWKGFTNAKIVGDSIVFDIEARPVFSSISSQILLTLASGYEVAEIVAESLPALEYVDLIETQLDGKTELSFPPDTKPGQYRIAVKASKKGVSRQAIKRLNVTIGKPEPGPGPEPPPPDMTPLAKASREAIQVLVASMANDIESASKEVAAGKLKTVLDLSSFTVPLDVETRNRFKKTMSTALEPKLGNAELKPDAPAVLKEVSAGFRSVK